MLLPPCMVTLLPNASPLMPVQLRISCHTAALVSYVFSRHQLPNLCNTSKRRVSRSDNYTKQKRRADRLSVPSCASNGNKEEEARLFRNQFMSSRGNMCKENQNSPNHRYFTTTAEHCHIPGRGEDAGRSLYESSDIMLSRSVSLGSAVPRIVDTSEKLSSSSSSGSSNGDRTSLLLRMMLPPERVSHLDRMLEFRPGAAFEIIDARTLVSREIGGTLRGL